MFTLLYPPACLLCRHPLASADAVLCDVCDRSLARTTPPICQRCGASLPGAYDARVVCARCRTHPLDVEQARAPWRYQGTARDAILAFKYRGRHRLGAWLAQEMADVAHASFPLDDIELVIPVPRHWLKRRLRGTDPARFLAARLARLLNRPVDPRAVRRVRWTATQTRLRPAQRRRNVRRAFRADPARVHGRSVLLIDDVLTSGATVQACAAALRAGGARRIFVLTGARATAP